MVCNTKDHKSESKMALYQELSPPLLRNEEPRILKLTSVSKSSDVCKANNDLQRFVNVSKKKDANSISIKRNKQLPKSFMIIKLSPLSKLISKRCRYFKLRHERIILFQGMVKKKKINIFVFLLYNSKEETLSKEIIKIRRCLISITSTNAEKISKNFEPYTCKLPREVKDQLRKNILRTNENDTIINYDRLTKPINKCIKYSTSHSDMDKLEESIISCNISKHLQLCTNSLTKINQNVNSFDMENSSFPLYADEEFYLVKRIYFIYIMSRSKKCSQDPTSSKKMFRGKDCCVSNIFKQTCRVHNDLMKKTARPCCGNHKGSMNTVMEGIKKKRRCIEKDYENMLRQISKLMHTCKQENTKLKNTSHLCLPKKIKCKTEIMPHCRNCKKSLKVKPKDTIKQKCMNNFGKKIKRTFNRCSQQAKSKLKRSNLGKKIKDTCGQCSRKAKTKCKSIHLDRIIKKLCGQCSRKVTSTLKSKLKPANQDCYMFSVHVLPTQKIVCEPEICHFKENAVCHFWSIMNPEQSNVINCAAVSTRVSKIENNTSTCEMQRRNCLKSKLMLVQKRTSVALPDVNNFAEYDICLQGMFKDHSKCISNKTRKSISFDIPEDNNSSCSSVECSNSQHACCYQNFRDTDEPILDDNELANECKNKLCNAKTSPIKVKLPIPKCIDCTRDYKQCDMGLITLPQNIEEECTPQMNSKKTRIIRRQKITPNFSPQCIIEIDNGNDLASLRLLDCAQQIKKSKKCKRKKNKKCLRPFWVKLFQKITKKRKVSKRKLCKTDSKELYKSFRKDVKNNDNLLTFSDFQKMDKRQLIDIIQELRKATCCDSTEEVETSSKSLSSDSYLGKGSMFSDDTTTSSSTFSSIDSGSNRKRSGINFSIPPNSVKPKNMDEPKYNLSKNYRDKYNNKQMTTEYEYVSQKLEDSKCLDTYSSETKHLIPKRKVFTSNYSQCEFSSKSVKNIYWRCATKDGKKKKKRNKLTKVKKPRILKQQIIKCHLSSHRVMRLKDKQERVRDFDNYGKNLSSIHSLECVHSLTDYVKKIEYHRPFWFKKYSNKSKTMKNQQSQACEADIEEQCENVEDHNAQADEMTFSVFELRAEKQIKHIIYEVENATWSYHSSIRKKGSTQTCVVDEDEPRDLVLSEDIELTFSDFETMDEKQLNDIICQLQNAMLSYDSFAGNLHRTSFEINDKQCGDDDRLTFRDFQGMSIRQLKDMISELEAMSFIDCDTSNSSAMDVDTSYKSESSSSSCISDGVQESVPSAVYTLSTYNSDVECNHAGFNFLIRPNNANIHKFFRIFRIK